MKSEVLRVTHELQAMKDKIKENTEKIKVNKTLPYLVSNVIEVSHVGVFMFSWCHNLAGKYRDINKPIKMFKDIRVLTLVLNVLILTV